MLTEGKTNVRSVSVNEAYVGTTFFRGLNVQFFSDHHFQHFQLEQGIETGNGCLAATSNYVCQSELNRTLSQIFHVHEKYEGRRMRNEEENILS